ncbi:3-hydroxyacyl-CoA dehydrogenase [Cocleimonas sp. KMM 6892]|uniref:3-hydroxyacyl-CoA dehydrogenase n=1 Tax=unclassified Cocleimonas TaxID=2639732 RepID=UPI002DB7F990|nr:MULTISPECIES: 3-hydroxyacyl-CoA dehydrogenase [unclassified Cocleimonas]MEB8432603.1 3-hydroxyacyl-CoA dehydrogenase [Cocleimonas sp. KMM 6892]MEC4715462.1 3-hydroxyacyl-CoA dehydrogenase [Cocleimonas sp. KMM 6895]MEC4744920.1 3-hydroxyacyl-CoA dehydrogenase [Cocleimonas sp. KMM 6896]
MSQTSKEIGVLVVGAGIMGAGIVQIAAQAGHQVLLYDVVEGAAANAIEKLSATFDKLVGKGKITAKSAEQSLANISIADSIQESASVGLVVEAIVENIAIKQKLFSELESVVSEQCILASNTSSISITAIANGLKKPERLVGMHFFNPVPLMKLVEVVSGLQTSKDVAQQVFDISSQWGKVPVFARSTPGFIVNRIARPFYAETLALLQEQASTPAVLDACIRAAGFRMGPCELTDLIGHDTNFAVTKSIYEANFYDKRFMPSLVQRDLVDGGLLGRKSKHGFYDYQENAINESLEEIPPLVQLPIAESLKVHGKGVVSDYLKSALTKHEYKYEFIADSSWQGLSVDGASLRLCDGLTATELGEDVAVFDLPVRFEDNQIMAYACSKRASESWVKAAPSWLQVLGFSPQVIADVPGLVVARTIAMLINEGADAVYQGVCTEKGADDAMKLGVNYPAGPFEWLSVWSASGVAQLLTNLDDFYAGERYRVSPWLKQKQWCEL